MVDFQAPTLADLPLFFTLVALELVLSFDNAAILAALSNRLPREQRRKALLYGLLGAYVFRIVAILVFVIGFFTFEWVKLVGAAYLIYLMVRHLLERREGEAGEGRFSRVPTIAGLSAFWSTVVYIEGADIAFALDQILVAVALAGESRVFVVIAASLIAIVFLRISAFYIGRVMEWFPPLETLAYIAVGWVGVKMLMAFEFSFAPWMHYEVPAQVSVVVTFSLIVIPPLVKFIMDKIRGNGPGKAVAGKKAEAASASVGDAGGAPPRREAATPVDSQ